MAKIFTLLLRHKFMKVESALVQEEPCNDGSFGDWRQRRTSHPALNGSLTHPMQREKASRWPDGNVPASVRTKLDGDYYDVVYGYHTPGMPAFKVTLMVHKESYPADWHSLAWIDKVGPVFIQTHFASSWQSIKSQVRNGERDIVLYSRVDPGQDVTQ